MLAKSPGLRGILARDLSKDLTDRLQSAMKGISAVPGYKEGDTDLMAAHLHVEKALDHLASFSTPA